MLLLAAPQRKPEPEPEPGGGSEPALPSVICEVKSMKTYGKKYFKKYLKMTIGTAWGGRAWAREEPTQLELVQSHLGSKVLIP